MKREVGLGSHSLSHSPIPNKLQFLDVNTRKEYEKAESQSMNCLLFSQPVWFCFLELEAVQRCFRKGGREKRRENNFHYLCVHYSAVIIL